MTFNHKRLAVALAILSAISITSPTNTSAIDTNVSVNVSVKQPTHIVNWYKGSDSDIIADGIGKTGGRGMSMSRMAAVMDAQRNLIGIINGVQIDSDTTMEDLIVTNDIVKRKISGILRGAKIIEEYERNDDEYYVKMRVPIYGSTDSLASVIVPELTKNLQHIDFPTANDSELTESEIKKLKNSSYTGVVINAKGLGMESTFSPVIFDAEDRAIYGIQNLNYDAIIAEGMVSYSNELNDDVTISRAGSNPLVINAVNVKGGQNSNNKVNPVISVKDAAKLLYANNNTLAGNSQICRPE